MSLKAFHIVFITFSVSLALAYAAWAFREADSRGAWLRYGGVVSLAIAVGLAVYGVRFLKKMRNFALLGFFAGLLLQGRLAACSACFSGGATGSTGGGLSGIQGAVLSLLSVTLAILVGFAAFFIYLWRSARRHAHKPPAISMVLLRGKAS